MSAPINLVPLDTPILRSWSLTPCESRVVQQLAAGHDTTDIARTQGLSIHTVRTHVKRAMAKAGVHNQLSLVACVYQSIR